MNRFIQVAALSLLAACCASPASTPDSPSWFRDTLAEVAKGRIVAMAALDQEACRDFFRNLMSQPDMDVRQEFSEIQFQFNDLPWYFTKIDPSGNGEVYYPYGLHVCRPNMAPVAALDPFWLAQSKPRHTARIMIHEFTHIKECELPGSTHARSEASATAAVLACFGAD